MSKNLVIVESPAKAKTIKKFLGSTYKIEASMGHVRDLPKSELGVSIDNDFEPKYITIRGKGELLAKLRKEAKAADKIFLATDPDREGEAISWHLVYALKLEGKNYSRITFNEITKSAVKKSIKEARSIDMNLVDAQQSRRILDRVLGYEISPLLWKKIKKGLSAGRVQSVALRLICDREDEINSFIPEEYWTIEAEFLTEQNKKISAKFYGNKEGKIELTSKEQVDKILAELKNKKTKIEEIKKGTRTRKTMPPFTTSTLQQEASKQLNFAAQKTMMIAQNLYEGIDIKGEGTTGLVTYIRTDSVRVSDEAYEETKKYIDEKLGAEYNRAERIAYKSRGRTQDAHEAIRPSGIYRDPESVKDSLSKDQYKLYKLIWSRFLASQMPDAVYETQSIKIAAGVYQFRASGARLRFEGFMKIYEQKEEQTDEVSDIPSVNEQDILRKGKQNAIQHFTQPPARFNEAMLVKILEEIGVGRPSTYAPTISNIQHRGYVVKEAKSFYPTELGEIVNDIMKAYFGEIINADFTAGLEEELDRVEEGSIGWREVVRHFYTPFSDALKIAEEKIGDIEIEDEITDEKCENCGRFMVIKYGKFGRFLACPGFPDCRSTKPLFEEAGVSCPLCQKRVFIKKTKKGRKYFGCESNPDCGFMSWNKPTGEKCPKCGDILVEKGKKQPKIVCNSETCNYTVPEKTEEQ